MNTINIKVYIQNVLYKHKQIKEYNQKANNNNIIEILKDYSELEDFFSRHLKICLYKDWVQDILLLIKKLKNEVIEYYKYEIKFIDKYNYLISSVSQRMPHLSSIYPIQSKMKDIVEWYQLVSFQDNFSLVFNEIIQPLSFPQLYNSDNRKILVYGNKGIGKFFIKALLTHILKINFEYDVLMVEKDIYTFNNQIVIADTLLSKMEDYKNNLIVVIRNLSSNNQFAEKYYNLFENKIGPLG